jgi:hypothetical protein
LISSGAAAAACGVEAAICAAAGKRPIPEKPANNKATEGKTRTEHRGPRLTVTGWE